LAPLRLLLVYGKKKVANLIRETAGVLQWCEVVSLGESCKALGLLEKEKFDGVILEADMPAPNGFELTGMIRQSTLNREVPVVMLTGDQSIEIMRKGFKAGVTFCMSEPSNRERVYGLFNAIRGAMSQERRRHARLPYRTKVICFWGEHQENRFTGESVTIGEGGMSLQPSGGLEVGKEITLTFALPELEHPKRPAVRRSIFTDKDNRQSAQPRAVVRFRNPQDIIGVEFLFLPPAFMQSIQRFVSGEDE
jgi:CheY-like chemotaxis protein